MLDLILLGGLLFLGTDRPALAVSVSGHTACPTAAQVEAALVGMIATPRPSDALDVVELIGDAERVDVKLTSASGEPIAEKQLPESSSCAERARTAAVIIAAWEVRLHPGLQPALPRLRSPSVGRSTPPATDSPSRVAPAPDVGVSASAVAPTLGPRVAARAGPVVAAPVPPPVAPRATPTPGPPVAVAPPSAPGPSALRTPATTASQFGETNTITSLADSRSSSPIDVEIGIAVLASVAAGTTAPAIMTEARMSGRGSPWALGVGGFAVGTHAVDVGSGQGAWRRFGGVVDLRSLAKWKSVELEMRAGAALSAVSVTGQSFPVNSGTTTLFDPGIVLGLRSRFRLGRVSPWAEATAAGWPGTHTLYVTGTTSARDLPPFELFFGLGASLAFYP